MLQNLHIRNYALIESLDIDFQKGFSVITGETGAGKSIIIGALNLLLGGRADIKSLTPGSKRCTIEATFSLSNFPIAAFFDKNDLDFDGNECFLRRELTDSGKSRAFINDTPVNISLLKELGTLLVDIHSQHQNLLLNDKRFQLNILDTVASNEPLLEKYATLYNHFLQTDRQLTEFEESLRNRQENNDYLQFQLRELEKADLKDGELEQLEEEALVLNHASDIQDNLFRAQALLSDEAKGICSKLEEATRLLQKLADLFPKSQPLAERLDSCAIEVDDIAQEISRYQENIQFDPARQEYVNSRLDFLNSILDKYHKEKISELLELAEHLRNELSLFANGEETLEKLRAERQKYHEAALQQALLLSESRRKVVGQVEKNIIHRLQGLGIPHIRFQAQLQTQKDKLTAHGMDEVTFLFSANKDMPLQDLASVGSGGEVARVMLSLKALLSASQQMRTLIFDEIDTGISGRIASQMATAMQEMAQGDNQVISITHLPQIAASGQQHYRVYKTEDDSGTQTHIRQLTPEERIQEIAHMLSGTQVTEAAISNAKALLIASK